MEKINEKRLSVLKVALELLKIEQTKRATVEIKEKDKVQEDLSRGKIVKLEEVQFLNTKGNKLYALTFVINHLKREFDDIELPKELQELKEQNILMALEHIHKVMLQDVCSASDFAESTRILGMLRKNSFEGL